MTSEKSGHILDNLCWYVLNSHHAHVASGTLLAKRYPIDMWDQSALADHTDAAVLKLS